MDKNPLAMSDEELMDLLPPDSDEEVVDKSSETDNEQDDTSNEKSTDKDSKQEVDDATESQDESPKEEVEPDYKSFYNTVMAPFKANGKEIKLQNAQEAIQLMQQGANYTRKMQSIAPYRKLISTLEDNGLITNGTVNTDTVNYPLGQYLHP